MACNEASRLQTWFDGELDASAATEVERHLESCRACAALLHSLEGIRDGMRQKTLYHRASPVLASRIGRALDGESGKKWISGSRVKAGKQFWSGALSGSMATG